MIWITTSQDHSRPAAASTTPERIGGFAFLGPFNEGPMSAYGFPTD